jgi:hypothetical protein
LAFRHGLGASELVDFAGNRWTWKMQFCTSVESSRALRPRTH